MQFSGTKRTWSCEGDLPFAQGGNSLVYRVRADASDIDHALKLFKSDNLQGERYNRFLSEIKIVESISSIEGCVRYEDHGLYEGRPFYVMPFYGSGTFRNKFLTPHSHDISALYKLDSFLKVLQIVKELHSEGLAVRDIKPQNILLDTNDDPVLADFGLSLWLDTCDEERHTPDGGSIGSQGYRAPEWARVCLTEQ